MTTIIVPTHLPAPALKPGTDCRAAFQVAYENRYTWDRASRLPGTCEVTGSGDTATGTFQVGPDLKARVEGFEDPDLGKALQSQLREVAIHRVRRPLEQMHGHNGFVAGDTHTAALPVTATASGATW